MTADSRIDRRDLAALFFVTRQYRTETMFRNGSVKYHRIIYVRNMAQNGTSGNKGTVYSKPGIILRLIFLAAAALVVIYLIVTSGGDGMEPSEAFFWAAAVLVLVATVALFSAWFRRNR